MALCTLKCYIFFINYSVPMMRKTCIMVATQYSVKLSSTRGTISLAIFDKINYKIYATFFRLVIILCNYIAKMSLIYFKKLTVAIIVIMCNYIEM